MFRRFAFVLLSCMALATPASAQNTAPEKSVVKLGIGSRIQIPYLAVNIAEHKGYFKEQGLTVEFNDFGGGGSDSLKALVSGSVDFIAGAYEHTLYLQARGQTITSVARSVSPTVAPVTAGVTVTPSGALETVRA